MNTIDKLVRDIGNVVNASGDQRKRIRSLLEARVLTDAPSVA